MSTSFQQQQSAKGGAIQNELPAAQVQGGRPRTSGIAVRGSAGINAQGTATNNSSNLYGLNNSRDAIGQGINGKSQLAAAQNGLNRIALTNQNKKLHGQVFQQSNGGLHIVGMQSQPNQTANNSFVGTLQRPGVGGVQGALRGRGSSDNTQGAGGQQVFYQMNNNFMVVNGGAQGSGQGNITGIQSGVGSVAMGQKTAYGFVGGINGQGLATMTSQSNLITNLQGGYSAQAKGNRNASSKRVMQNTNGVLQTQNASQGQSAGYRQILLEQQNLPDGSLPLNKRVLSANRASSLNASNGGSTGPNVILHGGSSNASNHQAQQFSMQQRRRHQNAFQNKVVHTNNFTGNSNPNSTSYGNNALGGGAQAKQVISNQSQMPQSIQSASSANFTNKQGSSKPNQKTSKIGIKTLQGAMATSQSFQRGVGSTSTGQQPSASEPPNNGTALSTDDGFLRGARIAEKIQEYYHTNSSGPQHLNAQLLNQKSAQSQHANINMQNQANGNIIKSYVGAATKAKQIRNQKGGGHFKIANLKNGPPQWQSNHQGATANRITRTSHGANGMRGRGAGSSHAPVSNQINKGYTTGLDNTQQLHGPGTHTDPSQTQNNDIIAGAFKGRASSSYGSLQSRTNVVVSSGSIAKQQQNAQLNLNKSGISATSGILNYSNYNSNGTMISNGPNSTNLQGTLSRYYQDSSNQFNIGAGNNGTVTSNTLSSNMERAGQVMQQTTAASGNVVITGQTGGQQVSAQQINSLRPITRDVKLRSQANRNNTSNAMPGSVSQASHKGSQIQNINYSQTKANIAVAGLNTSSALSGTGDHFDGKRSFNAANEARTFQNTINIGSFINEINNQNNNTKLQNSSNNNNNPRTTADLSNANQQQIDSISNFKNNGIVISSGHGVQNLEQVGIKIGAATTFSNTIDNTEVSLEDGLKQSAATQNDVVQNTQGQTVQKNQENQNSDQIDNVRQFNGKQINELNDNQMASSEIKKLQQNIEVNHHYNASATTVIDHLPNKVADETLGQQLRHMYNSAPAKDPNGKTADVNGVQGNIMFIQDSPEMNKIDQVNGSDEGGGQMAGNNTEEPFIKIYNQNQAAQRLQKGFQQPNHQGGISSSDIRQIKLNYIQLNKRATTANNGMGRKIPQKNQTAQALTNIPSGLTNQMQPSSQPQLIDNQQVKNQVNQYAGNAYQDGMQKTGINNWMHGSRVPTSNQHFQNTQSQPQVMTSQHIQNQYRQLQTRQTRRIINTNGQNGTMNQTGQAQMNDQRNAYQTEQQVVQLGRGQEFVHQHIVQQQQNQNQAAHLAQTHALAYHVEKYQQEDNEASGQQSQHEQNQFCTEGSHIENIDNYIIGKRIGQGAYAIVRVGLHKILNQKIAVKIYEKFKLLEPNRRKSVKREIKIMEKIDHECLAKLFEAFESHKQVFLIMEYVNGGSLHGYLKGKPNRQMAEIEAKYLWQQVVFGIHYLHQRNVTHRDIKLENILLDETRTRVKLIDFGFSTCIPHDKKVKIFCGTPSYMAPEIVSKIEYAGPPADIWALGVLLYALLCGRFPFKGQNDKELYTNICKQDLPLQDHISRQGRQLLLRIFHKNPDKRPSTKDILRDPWLQFSARDQEMMSPKSLAFISYLKKISSINFGAQQSKIGMNKTVTGFSRSSNGLNRNDAMDVQSCSSFHIQSKDKRNQLHASDVKQFILDENGRRNLLMAQQKQSQSIGSDVGSMNQSKILQLGAPPGGQYQKAGADGTRYNLNNTMPVGGIATESLNMMRQSSLENGLKISGGILTGENQVTKPTSPEHVPDGTASGAQIIQPDAMKLNQKINMEAYQAYYNTNDSCQATSQAPNAGATGTQNMYDENAEKAGQENGTDVTDTNNIEE